MYIHKLYLNQFNILLTRGINTLICFAPHGGCKPPFSSTRGLKNPLFPPLFPKVDFQKGDVQENPDEDTEIKPKKTRKMRKRGPSGGSIRRF